MKNLLLSLCLMVLSSGAFSQDAGAINSYQIEISSLNKGWVRSVTKTIDPKNVVSADFEDVYKVGTICSNGQSQDLVEKVEGIFNSNTDSQTLTLSATRLINIESFQSKCSTVTPIFDIVNIEIGFPVLSFEQQVQAGSRTYTVKAKRVKKK